jgi:hypothetical protein
MRVRALLSVASFALGFTWILVNPPVTAHGQVGASALEGAPHAVLVELFTSEGCSSCPPADALLRRIHGTRTDSGQLIVGISEHVTYWNQLGWSDPFSQPAFTDRQNAYGQRFHLDGIYTPQVVVNGEVQVVGSDGDAIRRALQAQNRSTPMTVHIVSAIPSGKSLAVTFSVAGQAPNKEAEIYAVIADDVTSSKVLRGENSGRTLSHVSVARSLTRIATVKGATTVTATLPEPTQGESTGGRHLILFAQTPGLGQVLSVESRAL